MLNRQKEAKLNDAKIFTNLKVRDKVLFKQRQKNKFTTKFELEIYTIIKQKGTKVFAEITVNKIDWLG